MDLFVDVCVRKPIMDPLFVVRKPIMDPLVNDVGRGAIEGP
jgi:hypothetical protein